MEHALHHLSDITFTVVVSNAGPHAADGAMLSNTILANLTGATDGCVASGGAVCAVDSPSSGSMTVPTFPVGGVVTYTLRGTLANWGYFKNTATVSPPASVVDPNLANNRATSGRHQLLLIRIYKDYTSGAMPTATRTAW